MTHKEKFIAIYKDNIFRAGAPELLAWLQTTDFFTAPASTKYHGAYAGGLVQHSLNVFRRLRSHVEYTAETRAICALLHDVCKADYYALGYRNVKNEREEWEKEPYYTTQDHLPLGHGEKSLYLISRFIPLTDAEALAIRWHMGAYDNTARSDNYKSLSAAMQKSPLVLHLHHADMEATHIDEREGVQS